jgi:hypothetical protein
MTVDIGADVGHDVPAGDVGHVTAQETEHTTGEKNDQGDQRQARDDIHCLRAGGRIGHGVDHAFDDLGQIKLDGNQQQHARDGDGQLPTVAAGDMQCEHERLQRATSGMNIPSSQRGAVLASRSHAGRAAAAGRH